MLKKIALALALTVACTTASAIEVGPLANVYAPSQKAGVLHLSNTKDKEETYQITAEAWTVKDGKAVRSPTQDIFFAPSVITVKPKSKQTVRWKLKTAPTGSELAFRIRVQEMDTDIKPTVSGVKILMAFDFPWIWRDEAAKPSLSARWDGEKLMVKNTGNATAQLKLLTAGAVSKKGLVGYVLPGAEEGFVIKGAKQPAQVSLTVNSKEEVLSVSK